MHLRWELLRERKIMFKFKLKDFIDREITASIAVNSPHETAEIIYSGDEFLAQQVKEVLSLSIGAFGHLIGSKTTAIDLDAALKSDRFKEYKVQLIEGEDLVKSYDPGIPEGAIT